MSEFVKIECPETKVFINRDAIVYGQTFNDGTVIFLLTNAEKFEADNVLNVPQIEEMLGHPRTFRPRILDD